MMAKERIVSRFAELVERTKARHFYLYGVTILGFGFGLDFVGVAGTWAPRFGAVLAGTVAFCLFNDLRQHEAWWRWLRNESDRAKQDAEAELLDARGQAKLMKAMGATNRASREPVTTAFIRTRPAVAEITNEYWATVSRSRAALRAQGAMIALGTFVWAFGDIPAALMKCGSVEC